MRKLLAVFVSVVLLVTAFTTVPVFANEYEDAAIKESTSVVSFYDGISYEDLNEADVLSLDYSDISAITADAKGIVDAGTMLYISGPECSAEDIAAILSIPKTNTTSYQDALLLAYSVYELDGKYIFANHYAIFAEETELSRQIEGIGELDSFTPEAVAPTEMPESNFSRTTTLAEYTAANNHVAIVQADIVNAAIGEKADSDMQSLNISSTATELTEDEGDALRSATMPSSIASII